MLSEDINLNIHNKKLIEKIRLIYYNLKNIVDNTKQYCKFCKIMNITQKKWEEVKFESNIIS